MNKSNKFKRDPYEPLVVLIRGTMAVRGETTERISAKIQVTPPTLFSRLRNPHDFKLYELQRLSKVLDIPWCDIISIIPEKSY